MLPWHSLIPSNWAQIQGLDEKINTNHWSASYLIEESGVGVNVEILYREEGPSERLPSVSDAPAAGDDAESPQEQEGHEPEAVVDRTPDLRIGYYVPYVHIPAASPQ